MADLDEIFGTDEALEKEKGVDLQYPGFTITIHRAGGSNKRYQQIFNQKFRPHRTLQQRGLLDPDVEEKVMAEVFAEAVITGWKGVKIKGKAVKYSKAACIKLLLDYPDLFNDIVSQATSATVFKQENEETERKN